MPYCRQQTENGEVTKIVRSLERLLDSIFKHSTGSPLHLIVITDQESRQQVIVVEVAGFYLKIENLVQSISHTALLSDASWR
jgi:hypothetical protein